jgi:hypothetical protein
LEIGKEMNGTSLVDVVRKKIVTLVFLVVVVMVVVLVVVIVVLLLFLLLIILLLRCQRIVTALSPLYYPIDLYDYCSIHVRCHYHAEGIKSKQLMVLTTVAVLSTAIPSNCN